MHVFLLFLSLCQSATPLAHRFHRLASTTQRGSSSIIASRTKLLSQLIDRFLFLSSRFNSAFSAIQLELCSVVIHKYSGTRQTTTTTLLPLSLFPTRACRLQKHHHQTRLPHCLVDYHRGLFTSHLLPATVTPWYSLAGSLRAFHSATKSLKRFRASSANKSVKKVLRARLSHAANSWFLR